MRTPGPWTTEEYTMHPHYQIYGIIADGSSTPQRVAYMQDHMADSPDNAAFIVKACNNHEALIAVLQAAKDLLDNWEHNLTQYAQRLSAAVEGVDL